MFSKKLRSSCWASHFWGIDWTELHLFSHNIRKSYKEYEKFSQLKNIFSTNLQSNMKPSKTLLETQQFESC